MAEPTLKRTDLRSTYSRFKAEVHTSIGILVPLLVAGAVALGSSIGWQAWAGIAVAGTLGLNTFISYRSWRGNRVLRISALLPYSDNRATHDRALNLAHTRYYLLGMSAEELQRSTGSDFFAKRVQEGRKYEELRILLLHPDIPQFHRRIEEVNRPADSTALVARKKEIVRALRRNLQALTPESLSRAQIRFYTEWSPWIVQGYDSADSSTTIDELEVSVHLPGVHSKYSPRFLVGNQSTLFGGFYREFDRRWTSGIPMRGLDIPDLYDPVPTLSVAIDLDGTLVLTNHAKRETTWELFQTFSAATRSVFDARYDALEGAPREHILAELLDQFAVATRERVSVDQLVHEYGVRYSMKRSIIPEAPGATEFLDNLSKELPLHIVSSAPENEVVAVVAERGWDRYITSIHGYPSTKSHALTSIADSSRISTREIAFVGDNPLDEIAALAAEAKSYSVSTPTRRETIAFGNLAEIAAWIVSQRQVR